MDSFSVEVQGITNRNVRETWYAKIMGFDFGDGELEEADVSNLENIKVTVCWFHDHRDPLSCLSGQMTNPRLAAIKKALDLSPHLLGSAHQEIPISTIQGRGYRQMLLAGSDRSIRQNVSSECVWTVCHRAKQIVSLILQVDIQCRGQRSPNDSKVLFLDFRKLLKQPT